jgi:hypothetical protein
VGTMSPEKSLADRRPRHIVTAPPNRPTDERVRAWDQGGERACPATASLDR